MLEFAKRLLGIGGAQRVAKTSNFTDALLMLDNHTFSLMKLNGQPLTDPYSQNAAVYRATKEIASRIGHVPFVVEEGDLKTPTLVTDPRVIKLFEDPNPEMTKSDLGEATSTYLDLRGECIWILEGKDNPADLPDELWPVSTLGFERVVDKKSKMIVGWKFRSKEGELWFPWWQVAHYKQFNPNNIYEGQSTIACVAESLGSDWLAQTLNKAYLENGADPGGVISTDQSLDEIQIKQVIDRWENRHRGAGKAKKVGALHNGFKYQQLQMSHSDMQYLEQRRWTREEVAMAFRIPFEIMGFGKSTYDNYKTAEQVFWRNVLVPRMVDIDEIITERILKPASGGRWRGRHDWTQIPAMQEDFGKKVDEAEKLMVIGVPLKEINRILDLKLELSEVPEPVVPAATPGVPPVVAEPGQAPVKPAVIPGKRIVDMADFAGSVTDRLMPKKQPVDKSEEAVKARRAISDRIIKATITPGERVMRGRVSKFFLDQRKDQIKRLLDASTKKVSKAESSGLTEEDLDEILFEDKKWNAELTKRLKPVYKNIAEAAGRQMAQELDTTFDPRQPGAAEFMRRKELVLPDINDTTKEKLRTSLSKGIADGESVNQLADRVREVFNQAGGYRALTIARTEAATTTNGVRFLTMKENGVEETRWITSHDDRVRPTHEELDGTTAKAGESFDNGLEYPGDTSTDEPGEFINCRCVAVGVIAEPQE